MRGARFVLVEGRPTLVALLANAPKDLNFYSGTMVGTSPTAKKKTTTNIPTYIIPVIVVLGTRVFAPTVADTTCMVPPNDVPLTVFNKDNRRRAPAGAKTILRWVILGAASATIEALPCRMDLSTIGRN